MPLKIGETFAGYRVLRLLGSGGMGEVYLVQHPRLPRREALKVLRADISSDASFRDRFIREADLAGGLRHPHIVGVHDRGEHEGQLWISMDYIDGTDLSQLVEQRYPAGMPVELVMLIMNAVASALDHAHKKGLLHRDVKPANIIVADLDTDDPSIFLTDFGIARPLDDTHALTTTNMTVGTVAYAAPEQLMGEAMDGRADEYALAATGYHLLTGTQLFPNSNAAVVISRHLNATPSNLGDRRPDCACLDDVVQVALAKAPRDRFPSCLAFAQALTEACEGAAASTNAPTQAAPRPHRSSPASSARTSVEPRATGSRLMWAIPVSIAAVILLIGVVALAWRHWDSQHPNSATTTPTTQSASANAPPPPESPAAPPMSLPTFPPSAIDRLLLGPAEIASVTGSTGTPLEISRPAEYPIWSRLTPASCSNVMFNAEHISDENTGIVAERNGKYSRPSVSQGNGPANVEERVLTFASVEAAKIAFNSSQAQWRSCAGHEVTVGYGESSWTYELGDVQFHGDLSSVSMASGGNVTVGDRACQTAIGLRANVVVDAWTCIWADFPYAPATPADPNAAGDYAVQVVTSILDRIKI